MLYYVNYITLAKSNSENLQFELWMPSLRLKTYCVQSISCTMQCDHYISLEVTAAT